jgi:ADP-ribosylation factor related protein 1
LRRLRVCVFLLSPRPQFSLLTGFVTWLFSRDELKILIVGLDYAGKTTLLEQIKRLYLSHYKGAALEGLPPTIGMNLARVSTQRVDVTMWDVGGAVRGAGTAGHTEGATASRRSARLAGATRCRCVNLLLCRFARAAASQMNSIWDRYYADADGLVFVIDSSDPGRFERVRSTLGASGRAARRP